jgi:hypothetical protein
MRRQKLLGSETLGLKLVTMIAIGQNFINNENVRG